MSSTSRGWRSDESGWGWLMLIVATLVALLLIGGIVWFVVATGTYLTFFAGMAGAILVGAVFR